MIHKWKPSLIKNLIILFFVSLLSNHSYSHNEQGKNRGFGHGLNISRMKVDTGFGINYNSPYFIKNTFTLRSRANLMFFDHKPGKRYVWTEYHNVSLGVAARIVENDNIRVYGEFGRMMLVSATRIASQRKYFGPYGLIGFEYFVKKAVNHFVELGYGQTGAIADLIPGKPIHANGVMINIGFRLNMKK
jgi:hypothetical protein